MRGFVLWFISTTGRYAVLPVIAFGLLCLWGWFVALDRFPIYALLALPIVLPVATVAIALLTGVILAGLRAEPGPYATRDEAPGVWRIWDELAPPTWGQKRLVRIDHALNASISRRSRVSGFAWPEVCRARSRRPQ